MGGEFVDSVVDGEEEGDTREHGKGNERAFAAVMVYLGDKIAGGDVQGNARGDR